MPILVVEDDPQVRSLVCRVLVRDDHDVIAVGSAVEAKSAVKARPPSLVLLDLGLPGGMGWNWGAGSEAAFRR